MKLKYTGPAAITLRHVTFQPGVPVELDNDSPVDMALAVKCLAMPDFEEVKRGRPKNGQDAI